MVVSFIYTNTGGRSVELVSVDGGILTSGDDVVTVVGGGDAAMIGDGGMMKAGGGVMLLVGGGDAALTGDVFVLTVGGGGVTTTGDGGMITVGGGGELVILLVLPWPVDGSFNSKRSPKSSSRKIRVWFELVRGFACAGV